jgi:hypothetical protein
MNTQSFLQGMSSVLEVFASNRNLTMPFNVNILSDEEVFKKDMEAVGNDFEAIIGKFNEHKK